MTGAPGSTAEYVISNGSGQAVSGWKIEFDLSAGQTIGDAWDGKVSSSGNHYVLTNESWNKDVPAGGSTKVGFGGSYSGAFQAPKNCTINGQACEGGSTTTRRSRRSRLPRSRPRRAPSARHSRRTTT